jgi:phosphate transport system substrate-binding protein
MAGSGAVGPLARALATTFAGHPLNTGHLRPLVEDSIGSGGGVRAVADGAVDLGLLSRPLSEAEQRLGLVLFPAGTDAVVLTANQDLPLDEVSSQLLRELFSGARRSLEGDAAGGVPVTALLRDPSESANLALDAAVPGMAQARAQGYAAGLRVLYRDEAMVAALFGARSGLGLSSLALLHEARVPLKILRLDGRTPSVDAVAQGRWPLWRQLWFAARPERMERVRPWLAYAASAEGRARIEAARYLPPPAADQGEGAK